MSIHAQEAQPPALLTGGVVIMSIVITVPGGGVRWDVHRLGQEACDQASIVSCL